MILSSRKLKEIQQVEQKKMALAQRQVKEAAEQEAGKRLQEVMIGGDGKRLLSEGEVGETGAGLSKRQLKKLKKAEVRSLSKTTEAGVRLCEGQGCGNPCSLQVTCLSSI